MSFKGFFNKNTSIKNKKILKINSKKISQKKYFNKIFDADKYFALDGNEREKYIFDMINSAMRASEEIEFEVLDA